MLNYVNPMAMNTWAMYDHDNLSSHVECQVV
ncbi:hypothetical protein ACR2XS_25575 [Klebsiella pneumoniae]